MQPKHPRKCSNSKDLGNISTAKLTLLESTKRLTKRLWKDGDKICKESASLSRGTARHIDVASADELARCIDDLSPTQALAYGVAERLNARIAPRDYCQPGEIPRTNDTFAWPDGGGVWFLDLDGKHDAEDIPRLRGILAKAMPELENAPQVWSRSSSGGIRDNDTGEIRKGGLHVYVLVADAKSIPTLGRQLYDALWLHGHGYHALSRGENPAALERCLIDASVWQPSRLDYAAAPILESPLERIGGNVLAAYGNDAPMLDPTHVKALSDDQHAAVERVKRQSRDKALDGVKRARVAILEALPKERRESQRRQWLAMDHQTITPDTRLTLERGESITAADVLADPERYNGQRCYDPQDPHNDNANGSQAMIYADAEGCRVWSLAHGGRLFRIVKNAPAAPADTVALPPIPDHAAIVASCYRHRAMTDMQGMAAVSEEMDVAPSYAAQVFLDHLRDKAEPLHTALTPTEMFHTFEDVAQAFHARPESLFCLAKLGTGKSRELGGRIVRQCQEEGRPVLAVTTLRALTWTNAAIFDAQHYRDDAQILDGSHTVSTTVHSMGNPKLDGFMQRLEEQRGVVVLDEAAAVAYLLFAQGGILEDGQRYAILRRLEDLVRAGVKFVLLDGDCTPTAAALARMLRARVVECTEQHYADPEAVIYPVQRVEGDEKTVSATPCHAEIVKALRDGERVVMATDSREQAERLHKQYAPMASTALCVHAHNLEEPEPDAFRNDPDGQAKRYQLVIYSPALSVGVSITSVAAHVFVFASAGTLDAAGLWQLARRYRRPLHDRIRFIVERHLCRPIRQPFGLREIARDMNAHAQALGMSADDAEVRGMVAWRYQRNVSLVNPCHVLIGHLANIGVIARVAFSTDIEGREERKQIKQAVRETRVERVAQAAPIGNDLDAQQFERTAQATEIDQARLERYRITSGLLLRHDEMEGGQLPRSLVKSALYDNLLTRVRRHAGMEAVKAGASLDRGTMPSFAYQKHTHAQAALMIEMVDALRNDDGDITVTASKARALADTFRRRIHIAYSDIPKPPPKSGKPERFARWLRDLLVAWGYAQERSERVQSGEVRERVYRYAIDGQLATYSERLARRHLNESVDCKIRLEAAS